MRSLTSQSWSRVPLFSNRSRIRRPLGTFRNLGVKPKSVPVIVTSSGSGGPAIEQEPEETDDPNFGMVVRYHGGTATFTQPTERETPEAYALHGSVEYMACNDKTCLPPRKVEFTLDIPSAK